MALTTGLFVLSLLLMVAYTLGVAVYLGRVRFRAAANRDVDPGLFIRNADLSGQPDHLVIAARHFSNQFELPVLFYAVGLIILTTGQPGWADTVLALLFVGSRFLHGAIHLGSNNLLARFRAFLAGMALLAALMIVQIIRVAGALIEGGALT